MNLSNLTPYLLYNFKSDDELIRSINEISMKFTTDRERIGDYLKDPRLVSAYTVFYLLTNIPKLSEVMKWLPTEWIDVLKRSDFIDLGAGPGTFSIAWKEFGGTGDFYQIELSPLMKEQGRKIWDSFAEARLYQSSRWEWTNDKEKFLLFGHSANEMGAKTAIDYVKKISPDHILFIEPGTKDFFPKMLEIRRFLLESGYNVLYPCPNESDCPMSTGEDWCHQFIQVKHDPDVERLSQMARKDRKLLPLTVHAYSKTFKTINPSERIVRVLPETKFSLEWEICLNNHLDHYQVMKRDLSKAEEKNLSSVLAGAAIESEVVKTLEKSKRVKVTKLK